MLAIPSDLREASLDPTGICSRRGNSCTFAPVLCHVHVAAQPGCLCVVLPGKGVCSMGWELCAGGYPKSQQHPGMAAGSSGCGVWNAWKDQGSSASLNSQRSPILGGVTPAVSLPGLCNAPLLSSWFCPQLGVRVLGTQNGAEPGIGGGHTHSTGGPGGEEGCDICSCKLFAM